MFKDYPKTSNMFIPLFGASSKKRMLFFCILLGREQKGDNHRAPREGGVEGGAYL